MSILSKYRSPKDKRESLRREKIQNYFNEIFIQGKNLWEIKYNSRKIISYTHGLVKEKAHVWYKN